MYLYIYTYVLNILYIYITIYILYNLDLDLAAGFQAKVFKIRLPVEFPDPKGDLHQFKIHILVLGYTGITL